MLRLIHQHPRPVICRTTPGAENNRYGFEGGRVLKIGGRAHLFISEMIDDPKWAKTRLAHWTSEDLLNWTRRSTLFESSGNYTGEDRKAALFLPQPVYDENVRRWNLFYSAFRSQPNQPKRWLLNHEGRAMRAVSTVDGEAGLGGPYENVGTVLEPGDESQPWEGLQGVDFFSPFRAPDGSWLAFYGSATTEDWPKPFWGVGLAEAESLAGPWRRLPSGNPVPLHEAAAENPIVHRIRDRYVAVYDPITQGMAIGVTTSSDGRHWTRGELIMLNGGEGDWLKQPRTPLGLLSRDNAPKMFDIIFTANHVDGFACIGHAVVKLQA